MTQNVRRTCLRLPGTLPVSVLLRALQNGHGYLWTTLSSRPLLIVHGCSTRPDMPELLIVGDSLIVSDQGGEAEQGLRRLIDRLAGGGAR